MRVVERLGEHVHQAPRALGVGAHQVGLGATGGDDAVVLLRVVGPAHARAPPAAPDPFDGAVDVHRLEQRLEPAAPQSGLGLDRRHRHRGAGSVRLGEGAEQAQHLPGGLRIGDGRGGEVLPDPGVGLRRGQQHPDRALGGELRGQRAAGPADLLVVRDRGVGRADVHAEAQVGLVVPHAQRRGRHHGLDLVGPQRGLDRGAFLRRGLPGVGGHAVALGAQELRERGRVVDGEGVDDARAREGVQRLRDPGEALDAAEARHHRELEGGPGQRAAQHEGVRAELGGDVLGDPGVRGRGRREHRSALGELGEQPGQALVVGAEVEAPVGDAVRLVDDEQAGPGEQGQRLVGEAGVGEPLGRDQQDVDGVGLEGVEDLLPVVDVRGVHRRRAQAGPLGGGHLIAHQRQQRGDDQRRAAALGAQG